MSVLHYQTGFFYSGGEACKNPTRLAALHIPTPSGRMQSAEGAGQARVVTRLCLVAARRL